MAKHTFGLSSWLERLGIKGPDIPEVAPVVIPVQVVGDASLLVSSLLPASAAFGDVVSGGGVGNHCALSILSRSPGGTLIRSVHLSPSANTAGSWTVRATDYTWASSSALTNHDFGPSATLSLVTTGQVATGNLMGTDNPSEYITQRANFGPEDLVFVPFGYYFLIENETENSATRFAGVFQDLPATEGPE